ncbi:MAG: hypothetical protein HYR94_14440 [Chloroflexi bacterium]|nr:hypothetical protein [Chloroflexota bacterium]
MTDEERIEAIQKQLQQIDELHLELETHSSEKFVRWREATKRQLKRVFGVESENFKTFNFIFYYVRLSATTNKVKEHEIERDAFLRRLNRAKTELLVMIDELNERIQEREINPDRKTAFNKNEQLEAEILDMKLHGLFMVLKTKTANLNELKERDAKRDPYDANLTLYNARNDLEKEIGELEVEISEVKTRRTELGKKNEEIIVIGELPEDELKILLAMKNRYRTARGIANETKLSGQIVDTAISVLATKELVAQKLTPPNQNRWYLTAKGKQLLG